MRITASLALSAFRIRKDTMRDRRSALKTAVGSLPRPSYGDPQWSDVSANGGATSVGHFRGRDVSLNSGMQTSAQRANSVSKNVNTRVPCFSKADRLDVNGTRV